MTDKYNTPENHRQPDRDQSQSQSQGRDRFELLSAYLDGEVTAKERQQVQQWLDSDPKFQLLYKRMQQLRSGIQKIPAPVPTQSPQQLSQAVFKKIDRQNNRKLWLWGSGAIAALFLGGVTTILPKMGIDSPIPQFAQNKGKLEIALNHPPVKIPTQPDLFPHISPRPVR